LALAAQQQAFVPEQFLQRCSKPHRWVRLANSTYLQWATTLHLAMDCLLMVWRCKRPHLWVHVHRSLEPPEHLQDSSDVQSTQDVTQEAGPAVLQAKVTVLVYQLMHW
jgi:hypothetical protein